MKKETVIYKRSYFYFLAVSLLSFLLLVSCQSGDKSASDPESIRNSAEVKDRVKEEFVSVKTTPVIVDDLIIKLKSPGEAVTDKHIVVKPEVSGKIINLYVEEGQRVKKGEVLIKLDDREYALNLESADAARLKNLSELLLESQFSEQADVEQIVDRENSIKRKKNMRISGNSSARGRLLRKISRNCPGSMNFF